MKKRSIDLSEMRREYGRQPFDVDSAEKDPFHQFEKWFADAREAELDEPNAMVVSTVDTTGQPAARTVLLKYFDERGFVFFTNYQSRKASHIESSGKVALLFPWYSLQRQVEVNGVAEKVSTAESIRYFASRPRGSQLGAWVSDQSSAISTRALLQNKLEEIKNRFLKGEIPKPPAWGGYRIQPTRVEFWQGGADRLHDRIEYTRSGLETAAWQIQRLAP